MPVARPRHVDTPGTPSYPRAMPTRVLLAALCLLPALARADAGPPTTDVTGTGTGTGTDASTGTDTMPPEYHACGCRGDQLGGGWALAVAVLGGLALRRRSGPSAG